MKVSGLHAGKYVTCTQFKNTFIVPTDAHYYKITEMLKQY